MGSEGDESGFPTVEQLMTRRVISVRPDDRLEDVARLISEHDISGFPVLDGERLVGVISEGDFLKRYRQVEGPTFIEVLGGFFPLRSLGAVEEELRQIASVRVEDIMSKPPVTARPEWNVQQVAGLMLEHRINRLPVVDAHDRLVGIISRGDVIGALEGWRRGSPSLD